MEQKRILIFNGDTKRLAKQFGVSTQTVRNALRFITVGDLPDMIRLEAIRRGGKISAVSFNTKVPKNQESQNIA
jgi:hypothetical protein